MPHLEEAAFVEKDDLSLVEHSRRHSKVRLRLMIEGLAGVEEVFRAGELVQYKATEPPVFCRMVSMEPCTYSTPSRIQSSPPRGRNRSKRTERPSGDQVG